MSIGNEHGLRNSVIKPDHMNRDSVDSMTGQVGTNIKFENGNNFTINTSKNHIPSIDNDEIQLRQVDESREPEDANVTKALKPLRDNKLSIVRGTGAFMGAGVGVLGGGAAGALKLAAIGAGIGTMIMPGIGTAAGAVVGGLVGIIGGAVVGGGIGRLIGHFVGKSAAAKVDVESLVNESKPGSPKFNAIVQNAGLDTRNLTEADKNRITDGLRDAMTERAEAGRPFGNLFIRSTLISLVKINSEPNLDENEKESVANSFLSLLRVPGRDKQNVADATVAALLGIQRDNRLDEDQKDAVTSRLTREIYSRARKDKQQTSPNDTRHLALRFADLAEAHKRIESTGSLDNEGKKLVSEALEKVFDKVPAGRNSSNVISAVLPSLIQLNKTNGLSDENAKLATDAVVVFANESAKKSLSLDQNTLETVLNGLTKIVSDQNATQAEKKTALNSLVGTFLERLEFGETLTNELATQNAQHFLDIEATLHGMQSFEDLNQEKWQNLTGGQPPLDEVTEQDWKAIQRTFRDTARAMVEIKHPLVKNDNVDELSDLLKNVAKSMLIPLPSTDEECMDVGNAARLKMDAAVDALLSDDQNSATFVYSVIQEAMNASRRHTSARTEVGLNLDGSPNLKKNNPNERVGKAALTNVEFFRDFTEHFQASLARKGVKPEQAQEALDRLMGKNGIGRSLIMAGTITSNSTTLGDNPFGQDILSDTANTIAGLQIAMNSLAYRADNTRPNPVTDRGALDETIQGWRNTAKREFDSDRRIGTDFTNVRPSGQLLQDIDVDRQNLNDALFAIKENMVRGTTEFVGQNYAMAKAANMMAEFDDEESVMDMDEIGVPQGMLNENV